MSQNHKNGQTTQTSNVKTARLLWVKLPNKGKSYVAPYSRAPAVSRTNGDGGGLRTYSRIAYIYGVKPLVQPMP